MFNCNKNDLFNPLNTKKNLFSKKNLISKWHSTYLSIVPVRLVPLCNCPNYFLEYNIEYIYSIY